MEFFQNNIFPEEINAFKAIGVKKPKHILNFSKLGITSAMISPFQAIGFSPTHHMIPLFISHNISPQEVSTCASLGIRTIQNILNHRNSNPTSELISDEWFVSEVKSLKIAPNQSFTSDNNSLEFFFNIFRSCFNADF